MKLYKTTFSLLLCCSLALTLLLSSCVRLAMAHLPSTLAMALEEGVVTKNSTFNCTGSVRVGVETIHCSKRAGHGAGGALEALFERLAPGFHQLFGKAGIRLEVILCHYSLPPTCP